jgi:hypothetical protein
MQDLLQFCKAAAEAAEWFWLSACSSRDAQPKANGLLSCCTPCRIYYSFNKLPLELLVLLPVVLACPATQGPNVTGCCTACRIHYSCAQLLLGLLDGSGFRPVHHVTRNPRPMDC